MANKPDPLLRHLALAIAVKLLALLALWWFFVHDSHAPVDAERSADHIATPTTPTGAPQ